MFDFLDVQVMEREDLPTVPLEQTVAEECHRLLPSTDDLKWPDLRLKVHNCAWYLCDLLHQLQTSPVDIRTALNECISQLVEVACQSSDDVCTCFSLTATDKTKANDMGDFLQRISLHA